MKYKKKPVVIDAVQYDGNFRSLDCFSINEVSHFIVSKDSEGNQCIKIPTLEGEMIASVGDYIIRGIKGEYYPCKEDVFHQTYERIEYTVSEDATELAEPLNKHFNTKEK